MAKKIFVAALGVLLVMALVTGAIAETKVEFKGSYRARYFNTSNMGTGVGVPGVAGAPVQPAGRDTQSNYFDQRFTIDPRFIISDNVQLDMRIRGLDDNRWGRQNAGKIQWRAWDGGAAANSTSSFEINRVFMRIKTGFGEFRVGRMSGGVAGLNLLGYEGTRFVDASNYFIEVDPFDNEGPRQRITWSLPVPLSFGKVGITAVYEKAGEMDDANRGSRGEPVGPGYDSDVDNFYLLPSLDWGSGGANVLFGYLRNRLNNRALFAARSTATTTPNYNTVYDEDLLLINPAFVQKMGPAAIHFEGWWNTSYRRIDRRFWQAAGFGAPSNYSTQGWGLYLDGTFNYGPGDVGLMFSYIAPTKYARNTNSDGTMYGRMAPAGGLFTNNGMGGDHAPFLVFYDWALIDNFGYGAASNRYAGTNNHWMVGLWGDHSLTESLMLHAALGYFALTDAPSQARAIQLGYNAVSSPGKNLGWEFDLGLNYKIYDGLTFTTMYGYFFTGNAWKYGMNVGVGNAWEWKNQMVLSF